MLPARVHYLASMHAHPTPTGEDRAARPADAARPSTAPDTAANEDCLLAMARAAPAATRSGPGEAAAWARAFKQEAHRANRPAALAPAACAEIVSFLRGAAPAEPAALATRMTRAADNAPQLAELILKTALVEHELRRGPDQPLGAEVVTCLRSIVGVLQQAPEACTDEGWANLARTLEGLESCVLNRLEDLTGGTGEDAEVIRSGVRAMQHDIEGAALKRDYERKLSALQGVERQIQRFFGLDPAAAPTQPEPQDPG